MTPRSAPALSTLLTAAICLSGCANGPSESLSTSDSVDDVPLTAKADTLTFPFRLSYYGKRRQIFHLLDEVSSYRSPDDYEPQTVIRAVNAIQPLGKKHALATIDEYLKENSGEGVFLVLRVLFDVPQPPGHMPPMLVGSTSAPTPGNHRLLSRSPIILHDDIPYLLGSGHFHLSGVAEAPEEHVRYFRQYGTIRAKLLSPPNSPTESLTRLIRDLESEEIDFRRDALVKQGRSLRIALHHPSR